MEFHWFAVACLALIIIESSIAHRWHDRYQDDEDRKNSTEDRKWASERGSGGYHGHGHDHGGGHWGHGGHDEHHNWGQGHGGHHWGHNHKDHDRDGYECKDHDKDGKYPDKKQPDVKQPDVKQPDVKQPDVKKPDEKQPDKNQTEEKKPEVQTSEGDRSGGSQPGGNQPSEQIPEGDSSAGSQSEGNQPNGQSSEGNRPTGDQPSEQTPEGDRPAGNQPEGNQPSEQTPEGGGSAGSQSEGNQPSEQTPEGVGSVSNQPDGQNPEINYPDGKAPDAQQPDENTRDVESIDVRQGGTSEPVKMTRVRRATGYYAVSKDRNRGFSSHRGFDLDGEIENDYGQGYNNNYETGYNHGHNHGHNYGNGWNNGHDNDREKEPHRESKPKPKPDGNSGSDGILFNGLNKTEKKEQLLRGYWPWVNQRFTQPVQSPVAISTKNARKDNLPDLEFQNYWENKKEVVRLRNDGYTVVTTLADNVSEEDKPYIQGGPLRDKYIFEQMHFHWGKTDNDGSEHTLDGKTYSTEMHVVHIKEEYRTMEEAQRHYDGIAVVAFFGLTKQGDNRDLSGFINDLQQVRRCNSSILLPVQRTFECVKGVAARANRYYAYPGSLTTPPFSESVIWIVFPDTFQISSRQLNEFRQLRDCQNRGLIRKNDRELQPFNNRPVIKAY